MDFGDVVQGASDTGILWISLAKLVHIWLIFIIRSCYSLQPAMTHPPPVPKILAGLENTDFMEDIEARAQVLRFFILFIYCDLTCRFIRDSTEFQLFLEV